MRTKFDIYVLFSRFRLFPVFCCQLYVVGCNSNNVVVISPDGQCHRQLLSSKDGLSCTCVLDYDKSTNRLLVAYQSKSAFLFDVTKGTVVDK